MSNNVRQGTHKVCKRASKLGRNMIRHSWGMDMRGIAEGPMQGESVEAICKGFIREEVRTEKRGGTEPGGGT